MLRSKGYSYSVLSYLLAFTCLLSYSMVFGQKEIAHAISADNVKLFDFNGSETSLKEVINSEEFLVVMVNSAKSLKMTVAREWNTEINDPYWSNKSVRFVMVDLFMMPESENSIKNAIERNFILDFDDPRMELDYLSDRIKSYKKQLFSYEGCEQDYPIMIFNNGESVYSKSNSFDIPCLGQFLKDFHGSLTSRPVVRLATYTCPYSYTLSGGDFKGSYAEYYSRSINNERRLKLKGTYTDTGLRAGVWTEYYLNGYVRSRSFYSNGDLVCIQMFYDITGQAIAQVISGTRYDISPKYIGKVKMSVIDKNVQSPERFQLFPSSYSLGVEVEQFIRETPNGAKAAIGSKVVSLLNNGPATGKLEVGDIIVQVNRVLSNTKNLLLPPNHEAINLDGEAKLRILREGEYLDVYLSPLYVTPLPEFRALESGRKEYERLKKHQNQ